MRRRYQLNLYTESDLESEVADYIEKFPQGTKRSEEIRRLCLIGYQIIIRGKSEDEAILQSYDPGLQKVIANYVREERERSHSSSNLSALVGLLQGKGKSQEELLLEALLSKRSTSFSEGDLSNLLTQLLLSKGTDNPDIAQEDLSGLNTKSDTQEITPDPHDNENSSADIQSGTNINKALLDASQESIGDLSSTDKAQSSFSKRYVPSSESKSKSEVESEVEVNPSISNHKNDNFLTEAEDIDIDEEDDEIEDPLSRLGF